MPYTVENFNLVFQETSDSQSPIHSRPAECGSRQAIQARPDHPDRVVSPSRGLPINMQQVAPASNRFAARFNNKLPLSHQYRNSWPGQWTLGLPWEDLDAYAFPPAPILGKVVQKLQDYSCKGIILITPGWANMPWFWDLVAMSSEIPLTAKSAQPAHTALQSDPSQKSDKSKSTSIEPKL